MHIFLSGPPPHTPIFPRAQMAGTVLQLREESDLEKAVRAGSPERWNVVDEDKHLSILLVPLPAVNQVIVHSALIRYSPVLIDTQHASYAKNNGELKEMISTLDSGYIDEAHLAFLWLWLFEKEVLTREARLVVGAATVNVHPWRLALAAGIDDGVKRHLDLENKLPFLERDLNGYNDTIDYERVTAQKYGPSPRREQDIAFWEQKVEELSRAIQETQDELDIYGVTE